MDLERALSYQITRRSVLGLVAGSSAAMLLSACFSREDDQDDETPEPEADEPDDDDADDSDPEMPEVDDSDDDDADVPDDDDDDPIEDIDDDDEPEDDDEEEVEVDDDADDDDDEEEPDEEPAEEEPADPEVIVADVVDHTLDPEGRWDGPFGSVTMRLHRAWVEGEEVTFIRTDASDEGYASQHGLVHSPLLANALDEPGSHSDLYLFENAPEGQLPVMSTSPADGEGFSPAFRIHYVDVIGKTMTPLASEQEILEATEHGHVSVVSSDTVVNYPVITWPGGQIPVDDQRVAALGGGQLIDPPDLEAALVTLKLHRCYPGGAYIITSASSADIADSFGIAEAGATRMFADVDSSARITVFQGGDAEAPGYQPAVMDASPGDDASSPFREFFAAEWAGGGNTEPVTAQDQLDDLVDSGDLVLHTGTPETDPDGFVVNCPVLLMAPDSA